MASTDHASVSIIAFTPAKDSRSTGCLCRAIIVRVFKTEKNRNYPRELLVDLRQLASGSAMVRCFARGFPLAFVLGGFFAVAFSIVVRCRKLLFSL